MRSQVEIKRVDGNRILVIGPYSEPNNTVYRSIGGQFNRSVGGWSLPISRLPDVVSMFGDFNSDFVEAEANADKLWDGPQLQIGGYVLATRRGRDYAARLAPGVELISGSLPPRGGSVKNPCVNCSSDACFALLVPKDFALVHDLPTRDPSGNKRQRSIARIQRIMALNGLTLEDLVETSA